MTNWELGDDVLPSNINKYRTIMQSVSNGPNIPLCYQTHGAVA